MAKDDRSEEEKLRQQVRTLTDELKRLKAAGTGMSLTMLCDQLFKAPGILWGFVQQQEDERHDKFRPTPGSSGSSMDYKDGRRTQWRVFIKTAAGPFCDRSNATLQETVEEVFAELGLKIPAEVKWK